MTGSGAALLMCAVEVLGLLNFATFPALIGGFQSVWTLTNAEAGWISGSYFAGYVAAVPVLVGLTDRVDARRVLLWSLAAGGAASVGYAALADGFWSAMLFRFLQGVGLAGLYMPGLKILSDRTEGPRQPRYVAFYIASFSIGAALSYPLAGEVEALAGWRWAFAAPALGSAASFALVLFLLPPAAPRASREDGRLLDFRPVLRNRRAMACILGYAGHTWELFAYRSWLVAYLVFAEDARGGSSLLPDAAAIAAIATLLGLPASILGNELAMRIGRRRWILLAAALSVAVGGLTGFAASLSYLLAVALSLLYGALLTADSSALTAGTVAAAAPGRRGSTLAVHAFLGFAGGAMAPIAVGFALDAAGAGGLGWGVAFLVAAAGSAFTFCVLARR